MADRFDVTSGADPHEARSSEAHSYEAYSYEARRAEGVPTGEHHVMTEAERSARTRRNLALALGVVVFVALVYVTTFFRLAASIEEGRAASERSAIEAAR